MYNTSIFGMYPEWYFVKICVIIFYLDLVTNHANPHWLGKLLLPHNMDVNINMHMHLLASDRDHRNTYHGSRNKYCSTQQIAKVQLYYVM